MRSLGYSSLTFEFSAPPFAGKVLSQSDKAVKLQWNLEPACQFQQLTGTVIIIIALWRRLKRGSEATSTQDSVFA